MPTGCWYPCTCGSSKTCTCCSSASLTVAIGWGTALTAAANCGTGLPIATYVADWETSYTPFGPACYWTYGYNDMTLYPSCASGESDSSDPTTPISGYQFTVALIHDLINSTCFLACSFELLVTLTETVGGNTYKLLAHGLYLSTTNNSANHFCAGTFTLTKQTTDPSFNDGNGNNFWTTDMNVGPSYAPTFVPYTGGITGALPATITVTL